jgi:large conductance mechanosensitive channel
MSTQVDGTMLVLKAGNPPPPYPSSAQAKAAGAVTINYGLFINSIITFLIIALVVFLLVKALNRLYVEKKEEPAEAQPVVKECTYCDKEIPIKASRCPFCTSVLEPEPH